MKIARDHKNGDAGNDHCVVPHQSKPREQGIIFFAEGQEKQHGQGCGDHHIKRYHIDRDHRLLYDVLHQVKPIGKQV